MADDFLSTYTPLANEIGDRTGLNPAVVLGIIDTETGHGVHVLGNNIFGITPPGGVARYPDVQTAAQAFVTLMQTPRYRGVAAAGDPASQAAALVKGGYNTVNPQYASIVANKALSIGKQLGYQDKSGGGTEEGPAVYSTSSQPTATADQPAADDSFVPAAAAPTQPAQPPAATGSAKDRVLNDRALGGSSSTAPAEGQSAKDRVLADPALKTTATTATTQETAPPQPDLPWWQSAANYAGGVVGSVTHGLSFGLDNPLDRATAYLFPGSGFAKLQPQREQQQQQFQKDNPLVAGTAEVAGSIPTFVLGEGALAKVIPPVAAAGIVNRGLNLAGASARSGIVSGVAGAGMSDGDLADRGKAAAESAAIGVAVPPLFGAVGSLLRGTMAPIAARIIPGSAERQATGKVAQALAQDQVTPADVQANLARLGPEAGLVDAGGTSVRRLGETIANMPGPNAGIAETFLEGRAGGQQSRINTAIKAATGSPGEYYDVLDQLGQQRSSAASPLYRKAFEDTVVSPQDAADLQRFVSDRTGQAALQRGMRSIELENLAANKPFNPADYGVTRDENGTWAIQGGQPNLRLFDAVKRGLDSVAEEYRNPVTQQMDFAKYDDRFGSGKAVDGVRKAYVAELRSRFPDYAAALDAWSGPSGAIDALSMGRRALANDPEVSAKAISGLSDSEKEFFKAGVARALKDKAESVQDGADATRRIFGNQLIRDKIAAAFGDTNAFNEFQRTMESEAAFARTRNEVLKNSATARRTAGQADVDVVTPALMAAHGHVLGAAGNIGAQAMNALTQASGDPVKTAIARQLFTAQQPGAAYLNALQRAQNRTLSPLLRAGTAMGGVNALNQGNQR